MRIEHRQRIAAKVDVVWGLTEDVERWPTFTPTMTSVERLDDGRLRVGSTARVVQPRQRPRVWTVTAVDAPRRFEWSAKLGPMTLAATHLIEPDPAGAANTLVVELTGPGSGVFGRLTRRQLEAALRTENEGFRRAAEAASTP